MNSKEAEKILREKIAELAEPLKSAIDVLPTPR